MRLTIIIGSVRQGRFGPTAAAWFHTRACRRGDLEVDVIDLAQAWLPHVLPEEDGPVPPAVEDLRPWLATADAFVIVTPEYNHSFPASLKNAIDWYREEWRGKPVAFVSYGEASGGLRAVGQLRPVFTALEAVIVEETVAFYHHRPPTDLDAERLLDALVTWEDTKTASREVRLAARSPAPPGRPGPAVSRPGFVVSRSGSAVSRPRWVTRREPRAPQRWTDRRTPTPSEPPAVLGRVKATERIEGADHVDTDDHG